MWITKLGTYFRMMLPHQGPYPIYHYMYDHVGTITMAEGILYPPWRIVLKLIASYYFGLELWPINLGVGHGDELFLLFKPVKVDENYHIDMLLNEKDRKVSSKILQLWTNFAKHHDPNHSSEEQELLPTWQPISLKTREYLNISTDILKMDNDENFRHRVRLWRDIIRRVRIYRNFISDKMPLLGVEVANFFKEKFVSDKGNP